MSAIQDTIKRVNWKLLRKQKDYCLNEAANNREVAQIYEGVVALIDALQDAAYKDGVATESEIFGKYKE